MQNQPLSIAAVVLAYALAGCSGSSGTSTGSSSGGDVSVGGGSGVGGGVSSGGSSAKGTSPQAGAVSSGGTSALGSGGTSAVVNSPTGGANSTGGRVSTGGLAATGGAPAATGGIPATGGTPTTGGSVGIGGSQTGGKAATGGAAPAGGASSTGGNRATGGALPTGGSKSTGWMTSTGGRQTGGATSAGGGSSYKPCSNPCKVLPFGDSITHGLQSTDAGGYRSQLFKLVVAASKNITFLGSQSAGPATVSGVTFPKSHEGHDGFTIDSGYSTYGTAGISSLIPSPAFSTIPDIVLLMIGTNDITSTGTAATTTSTRLDGLLGKIVGVAPNALIVVAEIPPVSYTSADLTNYNSKIPGIVQARAAQGQHIVLADMSQMPKSDLSSDNVHPNDQGYAYIANVWYTAIQNVLP